MSNRNHSFVFYCNDREKSSCGYCKKSNVSCSNGMWASSLTVQSYQDLIDRGWRRSGKYCYKPVMNVTCCPMYTIRCEALEFGLSKSQKKIIKKVTTFLKNETCDKNMVNVEQAEREPRMKYTFQDVFNCDPKIQITKTEESEDVKKEQNSSGSQNTNSQVTNKGVNEASSFNLFSKLEALEKTKKVKPGEGADPNLPVCKKKKILRIEKKLAKNPNCVIKSSIPEQKSLEEFIAENDSVYANGVQKLRVSLVKTGTDEFAQTLKAGASLFAKYQMAVHKDEPDDCNMEQYLQFLVDSPLKFEKSVYLNHPGYGSFHQQYWLDNKLIAVGVIDILPKCVSAVYLFYDPDYHHMVLGTYTSIREIYLVRQLYSISPELKYYYMGFYIHSCTKMSYKAKLQPSYLLCPLRYTWHPIVKCIQKLDYEKYSIFSKETDNIHVDCDTFSIDNIPVLHSGELMTYSMLKKNTNVNNKDAIFVEYSMLVGPKLARQLIFCL